MNEWEWVEDRIRDEYDLTGRVPARLWLERYPEHRAELERLIREITGELDLSEEAPSEWPDRDAMIERVISQEMDKIQLERTQRRLGKGFAELRRMPEPTGSPRRKRPRIYAWVVTKLNEAAASAVDAVNAGVIDMVKTAKSVDILRQLAGISGYNFVPAPHGPLDHSLYMDAGVARKEGWLAPKEGYVLRPGPNAQTGVSEAVPYLRDPALAEELVRLVAPYSGWELGVWTTVLFAVKKLLGRGEAVTLESVTAGILEEEEWKEGKLDWEEFSDENIMAALGHLARLGLVPEDQVPGE